ncbi:MAG TPA: polysaccharide biosynthesis tyrosine autokinase [Cyclobacteriaceae bacterium]|nr:polysaccharide biosynthesis tyrosine autokinase [Cyclobacteriaceae bacterium]HRJ83303.1 polysaccharide biosynthesis tyrosine autokinase [Cyclobacteriaceae bacterium]
MSNANSGNSDFWVGDEKTAEGISIDFKRVGYRVLRFWYIVFGILSISLSIAWYNTRYATRIFPISASIIIREREELSGGELLYKNSIVDPYRNYLNEPYILRSFPLIQRVIEKNNFHVSFLAEGYVVSSEIYDQLPVECSVISPITSSSSFVFSILDATQYQLSASTDPSTPKEKFPFNREIEFQGIRLRMERVSNRNTENFIGKNYRLVINLPERVAQSYSSRLQVSWAEVGAGVMNLSMSGPNPKKDTDFLNALVDEYQRYDLDKKNMAAERTIVFINRQLQEISDSLKLVSSMIQKFNRERSVHESQSQAQALFEQLSDLEKQKLEFDLKQKYYNYIEQYLASPDSLDQILLPAAMGISDPILTGIVTRMIDLQALVRLNRPKTQAENPLYQNSIRQIQSAQRDILEGIRTQRAADGIRYTSLKNQINLLEKQLRLLPVTEQERMEINRNYTLLENLYVFLLQKQSEAAISKAANTSDILPVNPPVMGGATSPKPFQNYLIATVIGLLIPLVLFVLMEFINNKVQSKEDVNRYTTIPFIGGVGHNETGLSLVVKGKPKSGISESFRALRSNLNFFVQNQTGKVFMITSSISGEGKTFTTINLASVFALSGRKTLIVGADMRRPKIFSDLGLRNDRGLSTYLSGIHNLEDIVQTTEIENLYLVSGGPVPPNPSELLMTDRLTTFKNETLKQFDYIIFDTPPLALVTDAFVISNQVDHTVFVVRQNYTPRDFLKSIQDYYAEGKLKNMSVLLNDIVKSGLGYGYGYGYQYGYSYQYGYGIRKRKNGNGYYEE